MDDILKFTNLKAGVLWSKIGNKDVLGEARVIMDYGDKPVDTVSIKKKTQTLWRNEATGQVLPKLTELDKAGGEVWVKYKAKVPYAYNLNGESRPFGPVVGRTAVKEELPK